MNWRLHNSSGSRFAEICIVCIIATKVLGCSKVERLPGPQPQPVRGKVVLQGKPTKGLCVAFHPVKQWEGAQFAPSGVTDSNGEFQLRSYEKNDGAPVGEYVVTFTWPQEIPGPDPEDIPRRVDRLRGRSAILKSQPSKSQFTKVTTTWSRLSSSSGVNMKTKAAVIVFLALFGWAFIETGQLAGLANRFQRPPISQSTRQVEVLEETPEYRLVKHQLGETRVPLRPRRIVSLTNSATDGLIALGIKPVLFTTSWRADSVTPYLKKDLHEIPRVRNGEAINLEVVLQAKPDLIFVGTNDGRLYNQLEKIAPTICVASFTQAKREERVLDIGDSIGMASAAQARLDEFHDKLASAKKTLSAVVGKKPVSFLRFRRNTCVIYTRTTMFGPLLFEQLALTPDPKMPMVMAGGGWDVLSVERLSTLRSEYIFMVVDADSEVYLSRIQDTPIWREIPAVKHGHVIRVASGTWLSGDGVLGCEAIINDVLAGIVSGRSRDALR